MLWKPTKSDRERRHAASSIRRGLVFAGLILACSLLAKVATALGAIPDADVSRRVTMAILGIFFVFMGNAFPKMLTPLSQLTCDPAKVQAFQRFTGWTWVLTGFPFAFVWIVLPLDVAKPLSMLILLSGMLLVALRVVQLRRPRQNV
jgi:hypothetical protein